MNLLQIQKPSPADFPVEPIISKSLPSFIC
jgi:hypothetical protein